MDIHARRHAATPSFTRETKFGQLERLYVVNLNATPQLSLDHATTLIFASIRPCKIEAHHGVLDIHYFSNFSTAALVDVTCIQCVVGTIEIKPPQHPKFAIIDRSGGLARALYMEDG